MMLTSTLGSGSISAILLAAASLSSSNCMTEAFTPIFTTNRAIQKAPTPTTRLHSQSNGNQINDDTNGYIKNSNENHSRRKFITNASSGFLATSLLLSSSLGGKGGMVANAAEDGEQDLTSQMFNPDGSLKGSVDGIVEAAKENTISASFPVTTANGDGSTTAISSVDGSPISPIANENESTSSSSMIQTSYQIPEKWTAAPEYLDTDLRTTNTKAKACDRITVFQVPDNYFTFKSSNTEQELYKQLEKATTIGVAKALGLTTTEKGIFPRSLLSADVIGGKKVNKAKTRSVNNDEDEGTRKYYEFDLVVAPDTCGNSAENLGLGFCPYDTIVLLSATVVKGKMMVCGVTSTKEEWKLSNSDLKRVRGSFFVE